MKGGLIRPVPSRRCEALALVVGRIIVKAHVVAGFGVVYKAQAWVVLGHGNDRHADQTTRNP